jgi:hypothetical protein
MTDKIPNYSAEQTAALVAVYVAATTDADRKTVVTSQAAILKKSPASIRAKLVREKVYVKITRTTKAGEKVESKAAIVERIAELMDVESDVVGSLESATKKVLQLVAVALTPEMADAEDGEEA